MQSNPLTKEAADRSARFEKKARVLLDLFGPKGLERLQHAGLEPGIVAAIEQASDTAPEEDASANAQAGLLQRFRDRGLLHNPEPSDPPAPRPASDLGSTVGQRIAAHLCEDALEQENPAVIAFILRSQPKAMQARVLRALPGSCARATMRHMKG